MKQTQVVTYGIDGVLAELLRELTQSERIWLRESSQLEACRSLVQVAVPKVLVVLIGRDLERELKLVEQVHSTLPRTRIVVVGESKNPVLAGLAWEVGASFVLFPPTPIEAIRDLILRYLHEADS